MLRRTTNRLVQVRPAEIRSMENRNLVRMRTLTTSLSPHPAAWLKLSVRTCSRFHIPFENVWDSQDPFPASGAASGCDCLQCAWKGSFDIPKHHSTTRCAK